MPKYKKDGTEMKFVSFQLEAKTYNSFMRLAQDDGRSLTGAIKALMRNTVISHGRSDK